MTEPHGVAAMAPTRSTRPSSVMGRGVHGAVIVPFRDSSASGLDLSAFWAYVSFTRSTTELGEGMEENSEGAVGQSELTSRRDALKRGAVVGGLIWVAPAVQLIGISPAHAQTASGGGGGTTTTTTPGSNIDLKGISFIEFRFNCGGQPHYVKIEEINSATDFVDEGPNMGAQNCLNAQDGDEDGSDKGLFTLSNLDYDTEGDLVGLTVNLSQTACSNADFLAGMSKCAGSCVGASEHVSGTSAMFFGCP